MNGKPLPDPLGDNLKEALNSMDRLIQRIRDLQGVGEDHLAFFGAPPCHWNHLRTDEKAMAYLCGDPADKYAPYVPDSKGGKFCPDCVRVFKTNGQKGTL